MITERLRVFSVSFARKSNEVVKMMKNERNN